MVAAVGGTAPRTGRADRSKPTRAIWRRLRVTGSRRPQSIGCGSRRKRIEEIAVGLEQIADLPDPIGEVIRSTIRPNGLRIDKVRVPLGVVFFIYESRPNVTADAAAICVKAGNAVILRGGKEAVHSSQAIVELLARGGRRSRPAGRRRAIGRARPTARRSGNFWRMPRVHRRGDSARRRRADSPRGRRGEDAGHQALRRQLPRVRRSRRPTSRWPATIVVNSKCQRMGVCNAAESLLVHADVAGEFLPRDWASTGRAAASKSAATSGRASWCRRRSRRPTRITRPSIWGRSFRSRVVGSLDEAIEHINRYGSQHTDAIVTDDLTRRRASLPRGSTARP